MATSLLQWGTHGGRRRAGWRAVSKQGRPRDNAGCKAAAAEKTCWMAWIYLCVSALAAVKREVEAPAQS